MFKCRKCQRQFSSLTSTIFSNAKVPASRLLSICFLFANSPKGLAALQVQRLFGGQYKTAYVFLMKLRAAIAAEQSVLKLSGEVEIDGCFIGGHRRHMNIVQDGRSYRITRANRKNRCVVTVCRQRSGRTLVFVGESENAAKDFIIEHVTADSTLMFDGHSAWDSLCQLYDHLRVDHRFHFVNGRAYTNNAESFFSLLRRMHTGVHHQMSLDLVPYYAAELAWKQDHRKLSSQDRFMALLRLAFDWGDPRAFKGYWQREGSERDIVDIDFSGDSGEVKYRLMGEKLDGSLVVLIDNAPLEKAEDFPVVMKNYNNLWIEEAD